MLDFSYLFIVFFISIYRNVPLGQLLRDAVPPWDKVALGCSGLWFLLRPIQVICMAVDMTRISAQQKAAFLTSVNTDSQVECRIHTQLKPGSGQALHRTLKAQLTSSRVLWAKGGDSKAILWTGSLGDPWLGEAGGRLASAWHFLSGVHTVGGCQGFPISFLTC